MKQLLGICAGFLLALATVLGAFLLFYDYEYHKIGPDHPYTPRHV